MNTIRSSALLIAALALPSLGPLTAAAGVSSISEPASQSIIIHCGSLIDGLSETVLGAREVRVDKGVITALDNASRTVVAERDIDLRDYTCLPGLINTHVHFDANPEDAADYGIYARRSTRDNLELILQNAEITLKSGFTTVRHVGAWFPDAVAAAKALIDEGLAQGPNIQTAGPYLTIPGGGGDLTFPEIPPEKIPAESQQGIASTPEDFAQRAQTAIDKGAQFLKVIASGAVFSMGTAPGAPEMHQDDIAAVVAVAKKMGSKSPLMFIAINRDVTPFWQASIRLNTHPCYQTRPLGWRPSGALLCQWMCITAPTRTPRDASSATPRYL